MTGLKEKEKPTLQQFTNTEYLAEAIKNLPAEQKDIVTAMANSFIFGMKAADSIGTSSKTTG